VTKKLEKPSIALLKRLEPSCWPAYEMKLLVNPWGFDLKNIKYPITIWQGTLDMQAPMSHAKIYANLVASAQLKIIENEGHLSLLKNHIEEILRGVCSKI
jgi:pimeloyl-ACP methyl ester carboxylesterase